MTSSLLPPHAPRLGLGLAALGRPGYINLGHGEDLTDKTVDAMQEHAWTVLDRAWVRRPGHDVRFSPEDEAMWAGLQAHLAGEARFRPPRVRDLARSYDIEERLIRRLFRMAARRGDVEEVAQDHFFLAETVVEMANIARELAAAGEDHHFTVIAFRDRLDNGRKVAIQILEFFDRQGLTMRRGDIRRINPHKADLYSVPPDLSDGADGGAASPVGRPDFKSGEGRETVLGRFDSYLLRHPIAQEHG